MSDLEEGDYENGLDTMTSTETKGLTEDDCSNTAEDDCSNTAESSEQCEDATVDDDIVDVASLLNQFKDLAAHPKTRSQLVQDSTSLGGLVLLLGDKNPKIVEHTLEIFLLLTLSKDCCQALFHQLGFIESLDNIVIEYGDRRQDTANIARMAVQILNKLTARPPRPLSPASSNSSRKSGEGDRKRGHSQRMAHQRSFDSATSNGQANSNGTSNSSSIAAKTARIKKQKSLRQNSKTITLQIKGLLDTHDRDMCREKLLEVKGVISLTFDMKRKRATLRTKSDMRAEDLVNAILLTESMSASQVVYDEDGNENLVSFNKLSLSEQPGEETEDIDYPEYLSDADEFPSPEKGDKAMSRMKGEDASVGSSWFSSVSNFVKDAFYW